VGTEGGRMKKIIDYIDYEIGSKEYSDRGIFAIAAYPDVSDGDMIDFVVSGNSIMIIEAITDAMHDDLEIRKIILSAANSFNLDLVTDITEMN
jgi:hypothetical protein